MARSIRSIELNLESDDYPKLVALHKNDSNNMLVLTWKGVLVQVPMTNEQAVPQIVLSDSELGNHTIMKHTSSYTYFATLTGKIKWLCNRTWKFCQADAIEGKILALEVIDELDANNVLICGLNGTSLGLFPHP